MAGTRQRRTDRDRRRIEDFGLIVTGAVIVLVAKSIGIPQDPPVHIITAPNTPANATPPAPTPASGESRTSALIDGLPSDHRVDTMTGIMTSASGS